MTPSLTNSPDLNQKLLVLTECWLEIDKFIVCIWILELEVWPELWLSGQSQLWSIHHYWHPIVLPSPAPLHPLIQFNRNLKKKQNWNFKEVKCSESKWDQQSSRSLWGKCPNRVEWSYFHINAQHNRKMPQI